MRWRSLLPVAAVVGRARLRWPRSGSSPPRPRRRRDDDRRPAGAAARHAPATGDARGGLTRARDLQARRARRRLHPRRRSSSARSRRSTSARRRSSAARRPGTGFVIDKDGDILTNAHVVERRERRSASSSPTRRSSTREVLGRDPSTDLALLKVDPDGLDLRPLALGSSDDVQVGDPTIAIGNPFGLERTLTTGVVSATQRAHRGAQRLPDRRRHPDRRRDQPRQLGRPADRRRAAASSAINSQIATGGGGRRQRRHRLRRPDRHRQADPARAQGRRARRPRATSASSRSPSTSSLADLNLPVDQGALVQDVTPGSPAEQGRHPRRHDRRASSTARDPPRRRHHHRGRRQADQRPPRTSSAAIGAASATATR